MSQGTQKKKDSIFDACYSGDTERVSDYVSKGGVITEVDDNKMTMLHFASFGGHDDICRIIIDCPAEDATGRSQRCDLDVTDNGGWTPLHFAADRGHTATVELLLEEGANANAKDAAQRTPLHLAALGNHVDAIKRLLAHGAARKIRNVANMTAEDCARASGHTEAEKQLSS